jgi:hypothetical protein
MIQATPFSSSSISDAAMTDIVRLPTRYPQELSGRSLNGSFGGPARDRSGTFNEFEDQPTTNLAQSTSVDKLTAVSEQKRRYAVSKTP